MNKNYKIDFTTMTLTMSKEFADAAYNPSSAEYKILLRLQKDFPNLTVAKKTHRSPSKTNPNKGMTYARMEQYIKSFENYDELLAAFYMIKAFAGAQKNSYQIVKHWFDMQFPDYGTATVLTKYAVVVLPQEQYQVAMKESKEVA